MPQIEGDRSSRAWSWRQRWSAHSWSVSISEDGRPAPKPQRRGPNSMACTEQVSNTRSPSRHSPIRSRQQASGGVPPEFQQRIAPAADRDRHHLGRHPARIPSAWSIDLVVARQIVGPQDQFERTGAQSLRDIRPFTTRLSEGLRSSASGIVLAIAAGATYFEPAIVNVTVPLSALYALWVLTRRPKLPLRLPRTAACPRSQQSGTRQPQTEAREWDSVHRVEHCGARTLADGRGRPAAHDDSRAPRGRARRPLS